MQWAGEDQWSAAVRDCPKSMLHGPCAGVDEAGACEVPSVGRCTFLAVDATAWPYRSNAVDTSPAPATQHRDRPLIIADLPVAAMRSASVRSSAAWLAGTVDACLLGDNGLERVQFPPSYRARLLADAGMPAWAGINCRDRNRVALEAEIAACLDGGVAGLHCVTGDHPGTGGRPDAQAVFDLDSVGLVELAADRGVPCSVAHAPGAPPRGIRLPRLLAKIAAGADTVFIDHCGGVEQVATATTALRSAGFTGTVLACVPVIVDEDSARVLLSYAASTAPAGYVERIATAHDVRTTGITAATELSVAMLAIDGVDGIDLSGGALLGNDSLVAAAVAEIATGVRAVTRTGVAA